MNAQRALPMYDQEPPAPRVHKRARQTSREVYRVARAQDIQRAKTGKETRKAQVLRNLAAYWNRFQRSPTALELLAWMQERGERVRDVNDVRPKLHYLFKDGLVESAGTRRCIITGKNVHTWRVREAGSREGR